MRRRQRRRCSARTPAAAGRLPKSGRFTRSPGAVNSTCSIRSRMWSVVDRSSRCGRGCRSGRGRRGRPSASSLVAGDARLRHDRHQRRAGRRADRLACHRTTGSPLASDARAPTHPLRRDAGPAPGGATAGSRRPRRARSASPTAGPTSSHPRNGRGRLRLTAVRAQHRRADMQEEAGMVSLLASDHRQRAVD